MDGAGGDIISRHSAALPHTCSVAKRRHCIWRTRGRRRHALLQTWNLPGILQANHYYTFGDWNTTATYNAQRREVASTSPQRARHRPAATANSNLGSGNVRKAASTSAHGSWRRACNCLCRNTETKQTEMAREPCCRLYS